MEPRPFLRPIVSWWRQAPPQEVLLVLIALFSAFRYLHDVARFFVERPFVDFANYYFNTALVRYGLDPFDDQAVALGRRLLDTERIGLVYHGGGGNYPPAFFLLMRPILWLPLWDSARAWLVLNQLFLGLLVLLVVRLRGLGLAMAVGATFLATQFQPLYETLALGQVDLLNPLLIVAAWWLSSRGREVLAGVPLAILLQIKPQFGLLWLFLVVAGRWRTAASTATAWAALAGVGLATIGWEQHRGYLEYLLTMPAHIYTWESNLSLSAVILRLLGGEVGVAGRLLATGIVLLGCIGVAAVGSRRGRAEPPDAKHLGIRWGLVLVIVMAASPLTRESHLTALLFPFLLLLALPDTYRGGLRPGLFLSSYLLVGARYNFSRFTFAQAGMPSLLHGLKLLGVGLLGILLILHLRGERTTEGPRA